MHRSKGSLWKVSHRSNTTDLKLPGDTRYPSRLSGRFVVIPHARRVTDRLPRQLIQQTLGQQVSQPVAQVVAGFSKVFVGEIIERGEPKASFLCCIDHPTARAVQARRGETGPLSPDHLREAYVIYQHEFGRVGAARPLRSKKLFVR